MVILQFDDALALGKNGLPMELDWHRYWSPRDGTYSTADDGFLVTPGTFLGSLESFDAVPPDEFRHIPFVGLLGEPGIGKSSALRRMAADSEVGGVGRVIDMASYDSDSRLLTDVFNAQWLRDALSRGRVTLYFDALDECVLPVKHLVPFLVGEIRRFSPRDLHVRIASRTAAWPSPLEGLIDEVWGDGSCLVYELLPLSKAEVESAAQALGIDPEAFLQQVRDRDVAPMASRPLTLWLLLRLFERSGTFPSSRRELYEMGCRHLCEEPNSLRSGEALLSASERLALLGRVAVMTLASGRTSIWTGPEDVTMPSTSVPARELSGRHELTDEGSTIEATETNILDALGSGLFSARGGHALGWSHNSYAEFLAARYLSNPQIPLGQILSLLKSGGSWAGVLPQLRELASWLATFRSDVFDYLLSNEPETLLRSDLNGAAPEEKRRLVRILLELVETDRAIFGDQTLLGRLDYPGLADQLIEVVVDASQPGDVRRLAMDIARAAAVRDLGPSLIDVALDERTSYELRVHAAFCAGKLAPPDLERLRSLLDLDVANDPYRELRGWALTALWPAHLSATELFRALVVEPEGLIGGYYMFLTRDLAAGLRPNDVSAALWWTFSLPPRSELPYALERAGDSITQRALDSLSEEGVLEALAQLVIQRLSRHEDVFGHDTRRDGRPDTIQRRRIVEEILAADYDDSFDVRYLAISPSDLVTSDDLTWLFAMAAAGDQAKADRAARLAAFVFDRSDPEIVKQALNETSRNPKVREAMLPFTQPVKIDGPEAQEMKRIWLLTSSQRNRPAPVVDPPPAERVENLLGQCELGETWAWEQLIRDLSLGPSSTHYEGDLQLDLRKMTGWKEATDRTQSRLVRAAATYLRRKAEAQEQPWLPDQQVQWTTVAGYKAFRLLFEEAPKELDQLEEIVWRSWVPSLLGTPGVTEEDMRADRSLLSLAIDRATQEATAALRAIAIQESSAHADVFVISRLEGFEQESVASTLRELIDTEDLVSPAIRTILIFLFSSGDQKAVEQAVSYVANGNESTNRRMAAAAALMMKAPEAYWDVLWRAIEEDENFGRDLLETVAHQTTFLDVDVLSTVRERHLGDLYLWLISAFSPSTDPAYQPGEGRSVSARDEVARLRDRIPQHLAQRGTLDSVFVLRSLSDNVLGLAAYVKQAEERAMTETWQPPNPRDVLRLLERAENRLIGSGAQLLDALLESLARLQQSLHQETPAAVDLWNEVGKRLTPKSEASLSDYVARHLGRDLRERGVVVNREVEIRRGTGGDPGERTDIYIDAVGSADGMARVVKAVIEAKGAWNRDLMGAMEAQLVNRYPREAEAHAGLYLVGWYTCDQWDESDYRRADCPNVSLSELQNLLGDQAVELSNSDQSLRALVLDATLR